MKILNKLRKELIFYKKRTKNHNKFKKRLSIIGPEYFNFGKNISIGKYYKLHCFDEYNNRYKYTPSLNICDNVYIGDFFTIYNASNVTISSNCLIASHVTIITLNHGIDLVSHANYVDLELTVKDVFIGKNCWIGENVTILPGVSIGDNCIIGAGSVVTKSIKSNCIAVGNPARVIKTRNLEKMKREDVKK